VRSCNSLTRLDPRWSRCPKRIRLVLVEFPRAKEQGYRMLEN